MSNNSFNRSGDSSFFVRFRAAQLIRALGCLLVQAIRGEAMKTMFWILKINLALLFFCTLASGQTPDGLESQYGKPFNAFEIRPGIMLQIQKDNQGQITEMRIEPCSGAETSIHLDPSMEAYVVKEIIDELIPFE